MTWLRVTEGCVLGIELIHIYVAMSDPSSQLRYELISRHQLSSSRAFLRGKNVMATGQMVIEYKHLILISDTDDTQGI